MSKSHLSKGMRRHIRMKKAKEAKKQCLKESGQLKELAREKTRKELAEKEQIASLPDFQSFPAAIKEDMMFYKKYLCPHCWAGEDDRVKKSIETKQGKAVISECKRCNTLYRVPVDNVRE